MYNNDYLRKLRTDKGWTVMIAEEKLGMSRGNYTKLEMGRYKNIPCDLLKRLHRELGADLYQLLNITDEERND